MPRRMLMIGLKLGMVVGLVAIVVQALQRRDDARRRPPPPPWPPLDVVGERRPAPATEAFSLSATEEEVSEAARVTEHQASDLQQGLATASTEAAVPAEAGPAEAAWVEPDDGACPASHPVKAKLRSRVFHLPGMAHYDRTNADRCYSDGAAAEADGFRQAKR